MYYFGMVLFASGMVIVFLSDRFYKNGNIKDLKALLKVKSAGLGLSIIGMMIMINNYK